MGVSRGGGSAQVQEGRGRVSGTGRGDSAQVQEGIGRVSGSEWSGSEWSWRQCVRRRVIGSEWKGRQYARRRVSGSEWRGRQCTKGRVSGSQCRKRQCATTVTTHPPSPFLYLHTVSSSTPSQSPSLSLSEWSGRQCGSTGRGRVSGSEWSGRQCAKERVSEEGYLLPTVARKITCLRFD